MAESRRSRAPHQLPPGRHKLTRDYVQRNQRERILDAVAAGLAGCQAMSVEEIIGTAGVSRRTFYDNFQSKEVAFPGRAGCDRRAAGRARALGL